MRLLFFRPPLAQGGAYVNGPEILHLIRHDLQRAIARQPKPPTPRPMDASPWLAMSAMQKAIRRGREDLALSAAATLLRDAPDKLWRRVGCIAYEDVGLASLEAVGVATVALTGKRHRSALAANGPSPAALSPSASKPLISTLRAPSDPRRRGRGAQCDIRRSGPSRWPSEPERFLRGIVTFAKNSGFWSRPVPPWNSPSH